MYKYSEENYRKAFEICKKKILEGQRIIQENCLSISEIDYIIRRRKEIDYTIAIIYKMREENCYFFKK